MDKDKGRLLRLVVIATALVLSFIQLIPNRYVDVGSPEKADAKLEVVSSNKGFRNRDFFLKCVEGGGKVGEAPKITMQLEDAYGEVLKKDIQIGAGYSPGTTIYTPGNLPDFKLREGSIELGAIFPISYVAEYVNLGLDLVGGSEIVYQIPPDEIQKFTQGSDASPQIILKEIIAVFRRKLDSRGLKEIYVQGLGTDRVLIQLPGLRKSEVDNVKRTLETQGILEFKLVVNDESVIKKANSYVERGKKFPKKFAYEFVAPKDQPDRKVLVEKKVQVSGKHISSASSRLSPKGVGFAVGISFNMVGTKKFEKVTTRYQGRQLAIILDGSLNSAPRLNEPIPTGQCEITGNFSKDEADTLVAVLRSGSMSIKPILLSENTVGPTLGSDSIQSGLFACLVGGLLVLGFILFYYHKLGLVANFALVLNVLMLGAAMSLIEATLTLPGIAGFALTIGMAVDATVLIFERLREEMSKKQALKKALSLSYDKAFITIFDSNITTFLTALILYHAGNSAPVKGFCMSLMIGLLINFFASVFVTQTLLVFALNRGIVTSFGMKDFLAGKSFDFFKVGPALRICFTYLVLIGGTVALFVRSNSDSMLDIDFKSGNLLQIQLTEAADEDVIRKTLKVLNKDATIQNFGFGDGKSYVLRMEQMEQGEKSKFLKDLRLVSGGKLFEDKESMKGAKPDLPLHERDDLAFPRDITIGSVAAEEMFLYAGGALILAMLAILVYILIRFTEFKYGIGACIALAHDVAITLSFLAIFGFKINLTIFAALLTVVGYSLNDTIVIFDRIRENIGKQKNYDLLEIAKRSLNQTLSRTLLTSLTTFFVVFSLLSVGGGVIKGFAFTMLIGLITGTYSSIFIAVPFIVKMKQRDQNRGIVEEEDEDPNNLTESPQSSLA